MKFAHMADCHIGSWREPKLNNISTQAFEKAIGLNPMLFEAQYQYGRMEFNRGDLLKAAELFEAAILFCNK